MGLNLGLKAYLGLLRNSCTCLFSLISPCQISSNMCMYVTFVLTSHPDVMLGCSLPQMSEDSILLKPDPLLLKLEISCKSELHFYDSCFFLLARGIASCMQTRSSPCGSGGAFTLSALRQFQISTFTLSMIRFACLAD